MQNDYHQQLIASYEDEIGGIAYFQALTEFFTQTDQIEQLNTLVKLETQTSNALFTLIQKYNLTTKSKEHINQKAIIEAKQSQGKNWQELMTLFAHDFPPYVEQFQETLDLAPTEDKPILQQTVDHEIVLIEFANKELQGDSTALATIEAHLKKHA